MTNTYRLNSAASLLWTTGFCALGAGLLSALVPIRAKLENCSDSFIGMLGAAYFFGFVLGCLIMPMIIRRVQHPRSFAIFSAIAMICPILHVICVDSYVWLVLRILFGVSLSAVRTCLESWLNHISHNDDRVIVITTYVMIFFGMNAIGQNLISMTDPHAQQIFFVITIVFACATIVMGMTRTPIPQVDTTHSIKPFTLLSQTIIPALGSVCAGLVNGPYWAYGSIFLLDKGYSIPASAAFMSSIILGGACSQLPVGALSKRIGFRTTVILLCCLGISSALSITYYQNLDYIQLLILSWLFGASNWPVYSLSVAEANVRIADQDRVPIASSLLLLYAVGSIIGSLLMSLVSTYYGISSFFLVMVGIQTLLFCLVLLAKPKRRRRSAVTGRAKDEQTIAPIDPLFVYTLNPRAVEIPQPLNR